VKKNRSPSLLFRITTRLSAITLAAIVLSYGWLLYQLHYTTDGLAEGSLIAQAAEIARSMRLSDGVVIVPLSDNFQGSASEQEGKFRYAVTDEHDAVVFASKWPPAPIGSITLFDSRRNLYQTHHNAPTPIGFFGAVLDTTVEGRHFTVSVERNSRHLETLIDTLLEEFFIHGAWVYIGLLLGLCLVSILTIKGVIRPVERLSREAAGIGPQSIEHRLSKVGVPREILGLVHAVNSALARLDQGFQVQREFTAAAAHELRTPLAILRAHIDTLADKSVARELRRDIDAMTRIVTQLLRVARLDAMVVDPSDTCNLSEVAVDVAAQAIPKALARGKQIEALGTDDPIYVAASADFVYHAVRNLVENAITHSGNAPSIEIEVRRNGDLRVTDHGPGIAPDMVERIFERFWRGQQSGEGSGLGLYIVKRIMELAGGRVTVGVTSGGGATFVLGFPLAAAPAETAPLRHTACGRVRGASFFHAEQCAARRAQLSLTVSDRSVTDR
jgi:signal transduction histidine kinase